jgi:hypothetical protein
VRIHNATLFVTVSIEHPPRQLPRSMIEDEKKARASHGGRVDKAKTVSGDPIV